MVGEWMMDPIKIPWFRRPGSSWSLVYLVRGGSRPNLTEGSLSAAVGCFVQGYLDLMSLGSIRALAITVIWWCHLTANHLVQRAPSHNRLSWVPFDGKTAGFEILENFGFCGILGGVAPGSLPTVLEKSAHGRLSSGREKISSTEMKWARLRALASADSARADESDGSLLELYGWKRLRMEEAEMEEMELWFDGARRWGRLGRAGQGKDREALVVEMSGSVCRWGSQEVWGSEIFFSWKKKQYSHSCLI
ncbi:hypothetical protein M5K25_017933 [Dendrobium thyrsiflorum]|uniref:Uncharacterized protein n=1 Tax=Dendrobium thyrsiflorum TaxID=117978 RepID=A0ABD0UHC6_DENTH